MSTSMTRSPSAASSSRMVTRRSPVSLICCTPPASEELLRPSNQPATATPAITNAILVTISQERIEYLRKVASHMLEAHDLPQVAQPRQLCKQTRQVPAADSPAGYFRRYAQERASAHVASDGTYTSTLFRSTS